MPESLFYIIPSFIIGLLVCADLWHRRFGKLSKKMPRYRVYPDLSLADLRRLELHPPISLLPPIEEQAKRFFIDSVYVEMNEVY